MRIVAFLGAVAVALVASPAHAEESPPDAPAADVSTSPGRGGSASSEPSKVGPTDASLRLEVERQGAAMREMSASLDDLRRKASRVRLSGFVQTDWIIDNQESQNEINGSTGQPLNQDRFTLRRGHVRVDAARGLVAGSLEIDANTTNGPQVRPIDAEVSLEWAEMPERGLPSFVASMGLMRIPFGFEVQESDTVRPLLERATMLQALFPGEFDLGIQLKAKYRFLECQLAAMNGNPIGAKVFPDLDPVQTKDVVGRLGVEVEISPGFHFRGGISGDTGTGFHAGTPATKNVLVWQDQNGDGLVESNEIVAIGGSPATPSKTFHRFALGADMRLTIRIAPLGDLSIRGEAIDSLNLDRGLEVADPIGAGRDLREVGYSFGATQEITQWAMVGTRYDQYSPDADASEQIAVHLVPVDRAYSTFAVMGMLRYGQARLLLEYDSHRNPLGIGTNGAVTTLADNALTLRGQVVF
jgi:hypothetical protein